MNRNLISFSCALALAANSLVVVAQNPVPDKGKTEKRETTFTRSISVQTDNNEPSQQFSFTQSTDTPMIAATNGQSFSFTTSFDTKTIKGKPYSADIVNEHIQTLGDGNRIVRRSNASVARDSEGRTRQEAVMTAFGPLAEAMADLPRHVTIFDPVAGTTYMLNAKDKTASKMGGVMIRKIEGKPITSAAPKTETGATPNTQRVSGGVLQGNALRKVQPAYPAIAKAAGAEGAVQVAITVNENGGVITSQAVSGHPLLREAAAEAAKDWTFKQTELSGRPVKVQGVLTFNFTLDGSGLDKLNREKAIAETKSVAVEGIALDVSEKVRAEMKMATGGQILTMDLHGGDQDFRFIGNHKKYESKKESLGKQIVEGVECDGARSVTTIPAGEMNNELPINIVTETWYSPELQVTVLRKFNDPRYGEDIHRLTNINRAEPAKDLFEVPSDYTIKETRGMFFNEGKMGDEMQLRMREIEEKVRKQQER